MLKTSGKRLNNSSIKNILVISLSNIGDVVASCPVIDVLCRDFPSARVSVVAGPKTVTLLEGNPKLEVIAYDKHMPWIQQIGWFLKLRRQHFDMVVDLRNTILPLVLNTRTRTAWQWVPSREHMSRKHLDRLATVHSFSDTIAPRVSLVPTPIGPDILPKGKFVVISPGAADSAKRWPAERFAGVADFIAARGFAVVFTGGVQDIDLIEGIRRGMKNPSLSLAGTLDLRQTAFVVNQAAFAVVHDSGLMHIAGYLGIPVIALYGPTDHTKSGPMDPRSVVIRRNGTCPRCLNPQNDVPHQCMAAITVEDVVHVIKQKFC